MLAMVEHRVYFHAKLQTFQAMRTAFFEMAKALRRNAMSLLNTGFLRIKVYTISSRPDGMIAG